MLMVVGMAFALFRTKGAGFLACAQGGHDHAFIGAGAARSDARGRIAQVGAIQIETDALAQLQHHTFAQTRIRAYRARLSTIETLLDAPDEVRIGVALYVRVRT
ncbi:MAG: hypothetical protein AB7T59_18980 [Hyphomonadaceae bacterium]